MADLSPGADKKTGWFKTMLGTLGGLLSGAVVMYLTPLVDRAVRPAKPVANFKIEINDKDPLRVRFQNLSDAGQGWWEFGDGSPLEPVMPSQTFIEHAYPHTGEFMAKMTLRNILGEENERSVPVKLTSSSSTERPEIQSLEVVPISRGSYAPATFRLLGKVSHAQLVVWELGDEQPLEVVTDLSQSPDKLITFQKPGGYVVKLAAFNGQQHDEKSEIITVMDPPSDTVTAILTVMDQGIPLDTHTRQDSFHLLFPQESKDSTWKVEKLKHARPGYTIKEARLQGTNGKELRLADTTPLSLDPAALGLAHVNKLTLNLSEDRHSIRLAGEMVRPDRAGQNPDAQPSILLPIQLTEQRQLSGEQKAVPVATTLAIPASGVTSSGLLEIPPLPQTWMKVQRKLQLELRQGSKILWQEQTQLPQRVLLTLRNRRCVLTATRVNDQVHLDLREEPTGIRAAATGAR